MSHAFTVRVHPSQRPAQANAGLVRYIALALVGFTFATSGMVFTEPAPVDALTMGLMVLLPAIGMVRITPALLAYLCVWLAIGACGFLAAAGSPLIARSSIHTGVSLYLTLASALLAAFIAHDPERHGEVVLKGWLVAAVVAALAGLAGYFDAFPGAFDLFTLYGRAAGTFKDPNVFGTFLIPPMLYVLHVAIRRGALAVALALAAAGVLALGILLSFSRGAWINLAISGTIWAYLTFVTAQHDRLRLRLVALGGVAVVVIGLVVVVALQNEQVSGLLSQRASMDQSYDYGPDGRMGGQKKAIAAILANPFGLGAQVFVPMLHKEEVHNVYLSMLLNSGWLGGGLYLTLVVTTVLIGLSQVLVRSPAQPLAIIAVAAFTANALEGTIIDSDHWRHFYAEMAMIWGIATAGMPWSAPGLPGQARGASLPRSGSMMSEATPRIRRSTQI